jgi:capsule biosynthesis phosphatase
VTYIFDLDGTLCTQTSGDYANAQPLVVNIKVVNALYNEGYKIIIYTARGMGRSSNDPKFANENFYELTVQQLERWNVKYHELFLGKPAGDYYIDDKAIRAEDFFGN